MSNNVSLKHKIWSTTLGRLENQYETLLKAEVDGQYESLLDVGCGFNSPVQYLTRKPRRTVGVDASASVIEHSRAAHIHDEYHLMDVRDIEVRFGRQAFDCVLASDVVDHLAKQDALDLMNQMSRVARKKVVIYTPNGFLPQGEEYGNPLQRHLSGWDASEMTRLGFTVTGIEGLKWLRGGMAQIRWRPRRFWLAVSLLSQPLTAIWPRFAFRLFCVKLVDGATARARRSL